MEGSHRMGVSAQKEPANCSESHQEVTFGRPGDLQMTKPTVIDFFCGAGGFSEGFRQEGFEIVEGIDCWKPAIDTFNFNFGLNCQTRNISDFERSVSKIEALPDTDVIIGSPPCVSFSSSNKSGKADKLMGLKLTRSFLRIVAVKKHKPGSKLKAWFMENVTNSRSHLPKEYSFVQLGLRKWAERQGIDPNSTAIMLENNRSVINAADYGVPQARVRIFTGEIIKKSQHVTPPRTHRPVHENGDLSTHITLRYVRAKLPPPNSPRHENSVIDPLYPVIEIKQSELTDQFYDTGLYTSEWKGSQYLKTNHPYMGPMSFPEREDRPSRTITATKIGNSREAIIFRSERSRDGDGEYRTLTIREAATLMGFPITFQFIGSEGTKWQLVGNAVCPPVSKAFARAAMEECESREPSEPILVTSCGSLVRVPNLNTFESKRFDDPPRRNEGARFRRHPFKHGNMTVTMSNYNIQSNGKSRGKWWTSIQYGTGAGFPIQSFRDGYFRGLEPIIMKFEGGPEFVDLINNGFSKRVARSSLLQEMYEAQRSQGTYMEPVELIEMLGKLIDAIHMNDPDYVPPRRASFKKLAIPKKQLMALYAINKICSIANEEEK
jgi:DNA (cytosine-5)-methyltransferase 1